MDRESKPIDSVDALPDRQVDEAPRLVPQVLVFRVLHHANDFVGGRVSRLIYESHLSTDDGRFSEIKGCRSLVQDRHSWCVSSIALQEITPSDDPEAQSREVLGRYRNEVDDAVRSDSRNESGDVGHDAAIAAA